MPESFSFIPPFDYYEHVLARWSAGEIHDTAVTIGMGFLVSLACGWIGCYLILQGMALLGDAISHTVLLGIVIAFLVPAADHWWRHVCRALRITGIVTVVLIESLHATSRIKEDAAIGIVFTSLFALGVVLLSTFARGAHIDTQHVLYGNLELVANTPARLSVAGIDIPVAVFRWQFVAAIVLA